MIVGVGIDLVDVDAFRDQLRDPASCFARAVFTEQERSAAAAGPAGDPARHLAARWAAKEALVKAWSGARFGEPPRQADVAWQEVEVARDRWGRPALRLHGTLEQRLREEGVVRTHVSLSHDGGMAVAVVILEGPDPGGAP